MAEVIEPFKLRVQSYALRREGKLAFTPQGVTLNLNEFTFQYTKEATV